MIVAAIDCIVLTILFAGCAPMGQRECTIFVEIRFEQNVLTVKVFFSVFAVLAIHDCFMS